MAWTALTFAFASNLTSTKMTQLQDNFTAMANGDSGAPNVLTNGMDLTSATLTAGSQSIGNTSAWVVPAGLYIISGFDSGGGTGLALQINSSGWKDVAGSAEGGGMVFSDGVNVRVYNSDSTAGSETIHYLVVT